MFNPQNKKHVVGQGDRQFITFVGLQARLSDQKKMVIGSDTEIIQNGDDHPSRRWIVKRSLNIKNNEAGVDGWFSAVGDAQVSHTDEEGRQVKANVGSMVEPHALRMAETRADVRILRTVTRSEYTAAEELG
jgi:hypothetical protein